MYEAKLQPLNYSEIVKYYNQRDTLKWNAKTYTEYKLCNKAL